MRHSTVTIIWLLVTWVGSLAGNPAVATLGEEGYAAGLEWHSLPSTLRAAVGHIVVDMPSRQQRQLTNTACNSTSCQYLSDGYCDDGGPGAHYVSCPLGTDCDDCGDRITPSPPSAQLTAAELCAST
eukprot:669358-Prymnesium_polylepis.1